jgi:hypothetical protein
MRWSDEQQRDKNETERLRYQLRRIQEAIAPFQEAELQSLRLQNEFLRAALGENPKSKAAGAA